MQRHALDGVDDEDGLTMSVANSASASASSSGSPTNPAVCSPASSAARTARPTAAPSRSTITRRSSLTDAEAAVLTAEEQEWAGVVRDAQVEDAPDHDDVVAAVILGPELAVEVGERVVQDR